jgi:hypothetical protein
MCTGPHSQQPRKSIKSTAWRFRCGSPYAISIRRNLNRRYEVCTLFWTNHKLHAPLPLKSFMNPFTSWLLRYEDVPNCSNY